MSPSPNRLLVSHAITLKGTELNDLILNVKKPVENRHFTIQPGWVALHNNADYSPLRTAIVGVARFSHGVPVELVSDALKTKYAEHVHGPICNVIAEVQRFKEPIPSVKGALSVWKLDDEDRELVQKKLREESETVLTGFDSEFKRPTEEQLKALKKEKKREREATRDEREGARQAKKLLSCPMFSRDFEAFLEKSKAALAAKVAAK